MLSMQGVDSALIARNESWVRKQAATIMRRLPSNVEKADLIQVGLIAVAQSALNFEWPGDRDTDEAREAFLRFARQRVKGAMLDELRQMDGLDRSERRKIKIIQIARERWFAQHGTNPGLGQISAVCGIELDEIARLDRAAVSAQTESLSHDDDENEGYQPSRSQMATPRDEVEARVDTAIVLRRLEKFFATLPERERQVIDADLGIGMSRRELAGAMNVSASRVAQLHASVCRRIALHFGNDVGDAPERRRGDTAEDLARLVDQREAELARAGPAGSWGELMEATLTLPSEALTDLKSPLVVDEHTRWG